MYEKGNMDELVEVLEKGGLLAFPTDTVFGLGCMMDLEAMYRVYECKGRSFTKPLPFMCTGLSMIEEYAIVNEQARRVIEGLMPGALTVVLAKKEIVDDRFTMGNDTIAIRVPDDRFILELIGKLGKPLLVTSANISGNGSLQRWKDVYECMKDKIEGIVCEDAAGLEASTIVDLRSDVKILREGPITLDMIKEITE